MICQTTTDDENIRWKIFFIARNAVTLCRHGKTDYQV